MTTQTSCSKKNNSVNMSMKYFLGETKRNWPRIILYLIMFVLFLVIPLLISGLDTYRPFDMSDEDYRLRFSSSLLYFLCETAPLWTVLSMIAAIFSGCYVTKILNNKISADFYHSIPLRRENIYFTRLLVGALTYFVTFIFTSAVVLVICQTQELAPGYSSLIAEQILKNVGYALLSFFMIYATSVFAGMLCGTTPVHFAMILYINFALFVYIASVLSLIDIFTVNIDTNYYFDSEIALKLLPVARFLSIDFIYKLKTIDIILFVLFSLLFYSFSLVLYKKRKIEKAGTPIVFEGFAKVFRYLIIAPATILGGLFFKALVGSMVWFIIGLILGAVLSFMLINTILEKNPRKMFNGLKGFAVYAIIMAVALSFVAFDVFGIDSYIPRANSIKSVQISAANQIHGVNFKDKDVIDAMIKLDKKNLGNDIDYSLGSTFEVELKYAGFDKVIEEGTYYTEATDKYYFEVVYKLKSGLHVARSFYVSNGESLDLFAEAVAESEDYEKHLKKLFECEYTDYYVNASSDSLAGEVFDSDKIFDIYALLDMIKNEADDIDYEFFQRQTLGRIHFYGNSYTGYKTLDFPIFITSPVVLEFSNIESTEEYYEKIANDIDHISIIKGNVSVFEDSDENVYIIDDKEQIKEILQNVTNLSNSSKNIFTRSEPLYNVGIVLKRTDGDREILTNICTEFLYGCVPDFVSGAFAE